jgi:hypothetical protein
MGVDPLWEEYPDLSPYAYCLNNPVKLVDPDGMAWKSTMNEETNEYTGYEWIDPSQSYDENGILKQGLYEQAIFFSDNQTFNSNSAFNMGSSTATAYKSDGTTEAFDATTNPSDVEKYATVPAGMYEAKVGLHKNSYTALRMSDVGGNGRIELGQENPAFSDGRTYALGINIHKPGLNNKTGMTSDGKAISQGCLLIDRNRWSDFIGIFDTSEQKGNAIGVTVSRTLSTPTNMNVSKSRPNFPPYSAPVDNTRVVIPNIYIFQ